MSSVLYQALSSPTAIRLLKLLPDFKEQSIRAELYEVDLVTEPVYEALSYQWGNSTHEEAILINNKPTPIRRNLWNFLRRIQQPNDTIVWADAICINQLDLSEKARQVRMMDEIFKRATNVVAWLGEHSDGSEILFKGWTAAPVAPLSTRSEEAYKSEIPKTLSDQEEVRRIAVWHPFLQRPYWRRTWIIQEIVLARKIIVQCGKNRMDWTDFIDSKFQESDWVFDGILVPTPSIARRDVPTANFEFAVNALRTIRMIRRDYQGAGQTYSTIYLEDIAGIARRFRETSCHDPRDKFYALLSLALPQDRISLPVNYNISIPELFMKVYTAKSDTNYPGYHGRALDLIDTLPLDSEDLEKIIGFLLDSKMLSGVAFAALADALQERGSFGKRIFPSDATFGLNWTPRLQAMSQWRMHRARQPRPKVDLRQPDYSHQSLFGMLHGIGTEFESWGSNPHFPGPNVTVTPGGTEKACNVTKHFRMMVTAT